MESGLRTPMDMQTIRQTMKQVRLCEYYIIAFPGPIW
jgi:hypothetical protein